MNAKLGAFSIGANKSDYNGFNLKKLKSSFL